MLISDSFHANVFGILLGVKNQWAYIKPDNNRGSRLKTLFDTFGLSEHFISPDLSDSYEKLVSLKKHPDFINKAIKKEMTLSRDFLNQSIKK